MDQHHGRVVPAANVPGLISAGFAAQPAAPAAEPLLEATPAREQHAYRVRRPRSGWESLSPGAKAGIMVGGGGATLVFVCLLVFIMSNNRDEEEPAQRPVATKPAPAKKTSAKEEDYVAPSGSTMISIPNQ